MLAVVLPAFPLSQSSLFFLQKSRKRPVDKKRLRPVFSVQNGGNGLFRSDPSSPDSSRKYIFLDRLYLLEHYCWRHPRSRRGGIMGEYN